MGDVLPPKRQTVVDRLKRRFELYRKHQNVCLPRFEQSANSLYESQRQDTILLKQRYLESKAKKAKSKSDHHRTYKESVSDGSKSQLHSKPVKRSADDTITTSTTETTGNEDSEKASKMPRLDAVPDKPPVPDLLPSQQAKQQNLMSAFSVQIVQQFSQSPLHQPSQSIQTTVTVQTGPKPQTVTVNQKPAEAPTTNQEDMLQTAAPLMSSIVPNVECKQEQDTDADLCQFKNNSQASNNSGGSVGDRLSDTFPSLEFTDESGENVIHPDILNDLIEDVIINSGDIMNDFNFEDSVGSLKDQEDTPKDIIDLVKGTSPNQLRSFQTDNLSFVNTSSNALSPNGLFRNIPVSSSETPLCTLSSSSTTTSSAFFNSASQRLPSFTNNAVPPLPNGLGLDFKLTEPSPAALTLKQMAEQHQNMQQKQQHLVNPSLTNRPQPFNQSTFSSHLNSLRPTNFLNASNPAIQNNNQKMLNSGTNLFNTFDQCISGFSGDETAANFPANCESLSPNAMFNTDVRNRTSNAMTDLQIKMTNHPLEQQNPPAYGTTRPLSHYTDSTSVRLPNLVSGQQQQQRPVGRQFQNNSGLPLQMNQVQQMQPRQHNPQQLQQNPHEMKQPPQQQLSVMQQHLNVYGSYPSQQQIGNPQFHVSMSQSLNFTSSFNANPAINRPPPEYKPTTNHRNVMSDNMHLVDQLNSPSSIFSQPTKNKYSKQQRPPNVTITPDGSAISSSHDWRNSMMNNNQQQGQFRSNSFGTQENYNLNTNGPVTANVPLSPMYNQYRMPNNQNLPNRMVRPNRMPQGPMIMQQRQRMVISQRPPRNPTIASSELHSTLSINSSPITPNNVIGPMYSEPQEIERQDGSHLNLDFLDSIGSSASDLLSFVPGMQDPNFPTFEEIEILSK